MKIKDLADIFNHHGEYISFNEMSKEMVDDMKEYSDRYNNSFSDPDDIQVFYTRVFEKGIYIKTTKERELELFLLINFFEKRGYRDKYILRATEYQKEYDYKRVQELEDNLTHYKKGIKNLYKIFEAKNEKR